MLVRFLIILSRLSNFFKDILFFFHLKEGYYVLLPYDKFAQTSDGETIMVMEDVFDWIVENCSLLGYKVVYFFPIYGWDVYFKFRRKETAALFILQFGGTHQKPLDDMFSLSPFKD